MSTLTFSSSIFVVTSLSVVLKVSSDSTRVDKSQVVTYPEVISFSCFCVHNTLLLLTKTFGSFVLFSQNSSLLQVKVKSNAFLASGTPNPYQLLNFNPCSTSSQPCSTSKSLSPK